MVDKSRSTNNSGKKTKIGTVLVSARISRYLFFAVFLILFVMTEYRGKDEISVAVNSFFRANPLVFLTYILAEKSFTVLLMPGAIMFVTAVFLGRFFCGWICPLGTTIDIATKWIKKKKPLGGLQGNLKYYILFTLLAAAIFNMNIAGLLDPIAILVRAMTFFFYPLIGHSVRSGWTGLYQVVGENRDYVRFIYDFLQGSVLPFRETFYPLAFLSLLFFAGILFLERYEERNWCKNLCPLGTLLGLAGRFSFFRRIPGKICADCGDCKEFCPTAFDSETMKSENCIRCMECSTRCRLKRARFTLKKGMREAGIPVPRIERRVFLGSIVAGFFLSKVFSYRPAFGKERLLRPPGVDDEKAFLRTCVRCGECMKVCLRSALYPAGLQAGLEGLYTPVLIPRSGYCEYNCRLCGQVCPTGAIPNLPLEKKQKSAVGVAVLDKNICLPYAKRVNCLVCEEHCPVPRKAIRFEQVVEKDYRGNRVTLKKPYVIEGLCIGCGICENKCPLTGRSAIEVFVRKDDAKTDRL